MPQPMFSTEFSTESVHKWEISDRLKQLDVACQCAAHKPLTISICNGYQLLQYWSIVRCLSSSRAELLAHIKSCWRLDASSQDDR